MSNGFTFPQLYSDNKTFAWVNNNPCELREKAATHTHTHTAWKQGRGDTWRSLQGFWGVESGWYEYLRSQNVSRVCRDSHTRTSCLCSCMWVCSYVQYNAVKKHNILYINICALNHHIKTLLSLHLQPSTPRTSSNLTSIVEDFQPVSAPASAALRCPSCLQEMIFKCCQLFYQFLARSQIVLVLDTWFPHVIW